MISFIYGILLAGSMIMAIGAQNVHVIKSGLSGRNVFFVSLTCFFCDFILMFSGVFLVGSLSDISHGLNITVCILSILFLLYYAANSFKSALNHANKEGIDFSYSGKAEPIYKSILSTLAVTLLNPHVYLDTVIVVGGYASSLIFSEKVYFICGALLASLTWFFSLGYFSRYLKKIFNSRKTWILFDVFVGIFMLIIALNIVIYLIRVLNS